MALPPALSARNALCRAPGTICTACSTACRFPGARGPPKKRPNNQRVTGHTVDGRNPFRTTLKPWESSTFEYLQGSRVACVAGKQLMMRVFWASSWLSGNQTLWEENVSLTNNNKQLPTEWLGLVGFVVFRVPFTLYHQDVKSKPIQMDQGVPDKADPFCPKRLLKVFDSPHSNQNIPNTGASRKKRSPAGSRKPKAEISPERRKACLVPFKCRSREKVGVLSKYRDQTWWLLSTHPFKL